MSVSPHRIHRLNEIPETNGPIVYWMSRDQRVADNWSLLHAQQLALERQVPLAVLFTLADSFLGATLRQYGFMLRGLEQVEARLRELLRRCNGAGNEGGFGGTREARRFGRTRRNKESSKQARNGTMVSQFRNLPLAMKSFTLPVTASTFTQM